MFRSVEKHFAKQLAIPTRYSSKATADSLSQARFNLLPY